jgi:hypothetical protein
VIETAIFAQAHGWQPYQVRQLCLDLGIPAKASDRTREDWYRLEVALARGTDWLSPTPPAEPDPYPVGTRLYLRSWFEPWFPEWYKPEWWEVTEPPNQHGIYGLRSDRGNVAGRRAWQIQRDEVKL